MIRKHAWLVWVALLPRIADAEEAAFIVRLSPEHQTVARGTTPTFTVTVRARSHVRMLRLDRRGDLKDNYAELRVTQKGQPIEVPVFISDPGPVRDEADYIELDPGQMMSWEEHGFPKALDELPKGTYTAVERLRADWNAPLVESNTVKYEVIDSK